MNPSALRAPKLVFVNRYFFPDQSATSQMLSDLAFGLAARGRDVYVVCSRQRYDDASAALSPHETVDGVTIHRVVSSRFGRAHLAGRALDYATFYLACAVRLVRLLSRGDTVVLLTDPPLLSILGLLAAKLTGAHLVNWLHDVYPEIASRLGANPLPGPLDRWLCRWRNRSLARARMNVVLGRRMGETIAACGITPERIRVIENWASVTDAGPKPACDSELRARLGLAGKFVVGYSGNLGRAHEYRTLLEAAGLLAAETDLAFLMVGGGAGMTALRRMSAERGLGNLHFHPYVTRAELPDSLAAADVHLLSLLPALEGFIVPSKFYGILASARPVVFVGDPQGEVARIIHEAQLGEAQIGEAVSVGDAPGLARVLRGLRADPARCQALGSAGHRLYCRRYTAIRALEQWTQVLEVPAPPDSIVVDLRGS
ncbi:MAG TPA: glycosyltransferase family 4 protein [Steroidobacteraceae bacterium]|nr:glycosyltransferase family 4 protein [Steroidobacteraceae bacterium]